MEQSAITEQIKARFPEEVVGMVEYHGQSSVLLKPGRIVEVLRWLRDADELRMDHLRGLCGVDNSKREIEVAERFEVVYQLYSTEKRHGIRLRVLVPEDAAQVDTASELWAGANWLEREVFDMFGIRFNNHPNMTRVLMPEDWEGHPLLKDYPLEGQGEWQVLVDLKEKARNLDQYGFYGKHAETVVEGADEPDKAKERL